METKAHLFCQAEENIDLSDNNSNSFGTNLPTRNIESKKYIKVSKTVKKVSPEIRGCNPEHENTYKTSVFLSREEKYEFSGEKKIRRKKTLQLHSRRTEIASPSLKLSKEKMTRKESTLCQLPNQNRVHKTSLPVCTSSSVIREKKMHSNLSLTLYEEIPQGHFYQEELNALLKACKIFGKIRSGKIYVNDLPKVLGTLKISLSDSEMLQALKTIDIDAFQEILESFSRIKAGRVAIDEVVAVLSNMNIFVNPDTLEEVIKYSYIDSNQTVDIGDIIFVLNDLQQQYEDVSIMEDSALDETIDSKLPNVTGYSLQHKKGSLPSRLFESSIFKKLNGKSLRHQSNIMENDDTGFKRSRHSWPVGRFLDRPVSSYEIHDSKSVPQSLKSTVSLSKSLDKIDISGVPKLEKLAMRRPSTLLKQVSSEEKTAINTLENVCKVISKLKEYYFPTEELQFILPSLGITLLDKEFLKIGTETTRNNESLASNTSPVGTVTMDFQATVGGRRSAGRLWVTCRPTVDEKQVDVGRSVMVLPDAIENLRNISKERMNVSDLWNILSTLNSNLKKDEFLAALKFTTVDGDKVQFDEFTKAVKNMRDASRLDELQEIVLALDSLEGDMICGKNLEDFLRNIGIKSPKEEAEKILQSDFVSEDNMVNIKDCMRALRDTQKFSNFIDFRKETLSSNLKLPKINEIKEAAHILSHVDNGKIDIPNLKHALKCLNVNLTEEDVNEGLKCCDISDNKEVDLKDFLLEMNENPHFKESKATQLLLATTQILQDDLIDVSDLKMLLMNNDLYPANAILNEMLRSIPEHEYGKVTIQEFMSKLSDTLTIPKAAGAEDKFYNIDIHKNDLTAVSDLQQNLNAIGIYLTDDKIQKTLDNTNPSDEVVHFKDFIRKLTNTDEFVECQRIEDAWNIVNSVSDGKVEVKDLLSTLKSLEKPLTEDHPNSATDDLFKEITTLDNIRNDKMPVDELSSKLTSIGVPLSQKTFQEILRQASVDENDEVSLRQILENLNTSKPAPILEDVYSALNTVDSMSWDRVQVNDLKDAFGDLSISLKPEEHQKLEKTLDVDGLISNGKKGKSPGPSISVSTSSLQYPLWLGRDEFLLLVETLGMNPGRDES
ncbi:LOW QUALITY PROTEIN: EF-hand calcium-binding domain-containing protein 13 [Sciurus carolinensis]|uniref:LOW QUALITY PROTEIN: EF-hand calcium-binding domain-containing protein 13 n=1 Tax=Sciurus carolinensis TaxID=30640 RepID=UPI001FB3F83A|nr:LOW QUALITY PROTEIN: EF-hand calcium-binding domain-containing protein 13 [Sciurus carolinensis]